MDSLAGTHGHTLMEWVTYTSTRQSMAAVVDSADCIQWTPYLRGHCHERDHLSWKTTHFLAKGSTFQYNWTCHQRPPVLRDHIFVVNGVVFQDSFFTSFTVPGCSDLDLTTGAYISGPAGKCNLRFQFIGLFIMLICLVPQYIINMLDSRCIAWCLDILIYAWYILLEMTEWQ